MLNMLKHSFQAKICDAFPNVTLSRNNQKPDTKITIKQCYFGPDPACWPFMTSVFQVSDQDLQKENCQIADDYTDALTAAMNRTLKLNIESMMRGCTPEEKQECEADFKLLPQYGVFCRQYLGDETSGPDRDAKIVFIGRFIHCVDREPLFEFGDSPCFPQLLSGMCNLETAKVDDPKTVELRPGLCLFVSGCTGKSRSNTFVCLVKQDNKLHLIMEPQDLESSTRQKV